MTKFLILAKQSIYYTIEVEAKNIDEAIIKADEADMDEFKETGELEWTNVAIYKN